MEAKFHVCVRAALVALALPLAAPASVPPTPAEEAAPHGAGDVVLWPSGAATLRAQPDSRVEPLPDGSALVEGGVSYEWRGAVLDFAGGEADLSAFGSLKLLLGNDTGRTETFHVNLKCRTFQGLKFPWTGIGSLAPGECREFTVDLAAMPWRLDGPVELEGMRAYPSHDGGGSMFDLRRTACLNLVVNQDGRPAGFRVLRISASPETGAEQTTLSAASFLPFVDGFGQFKHADWPGKIHSGAELAAARDREDEWLASNDSGPIPDADRFGGWAGGPQLAATGFFRTEKVDGKWWLVDPDGHLFFSVGTQSIDCAVDTPAAGRESYFEPVPDVPNGGVRPGWLNHFRLNLSRKYGPDWRRPFAESVHRRFKAWGLNTIGNWSPDYIWKLRRTPYTATIDFSSRTRLPEAGKSGRAVPDVDSPQFVLDLEAQVARLAASVRDDPWCLGVFVDNEIAWGDCGGNVAAVAEKYYSTVRAVLKKHLPDHLYLGSRFHQWSEPVWLAASRHCDVVSVNTYDRQPTRELPEGGEDKPMLVGEFHFGALDRGMFHSGLAYARDQGERAECYRHFVNACLDNPQYVGCHWYEFQDEPLSGRFDGENFNCGFVSVCDVPYPELVDACRETAAGMYARRFSRTGGR